MTLHMEYQGPSDSSFTTLDVTADRITDLKLHFSTEHASYATWIMRQAEHTMPILRNSFIRIWDDSNNGNAEDTPYGPWSQSRPQFEGFVDEVSPGDDSTTIRYLAYDPTVIVSRETQVMSTGWIDDGNGGYTEGQGATPRLVLNEYIDSSPDWPFERDHNVTVGGMITGILQDANLPLVRFNAAPSGALAWNPADIVDFNFRPQEKMVFDSMGIRSAIESVLRWEPAVKLFFTPGLRTWNFFNAYNSPRRTLTLNQFTGIYKVLSRTLRRSFANRYTAVKIYGPETAQIAYFSTVDGTLETTDGGVVLENYNDSGGGAQQVVSHTTWQIVDPTKRRGWRRLPTPQYVPIGSYFYQLTYSPTLQYSFDGGTTWNTHSWPIWDFQNGRVTIGNSHIFLYINPAPFPPTTQHYFIPNAIRIQYAYHLTPLSVRSPLTGYSGTAYTVANTQTTLRARDPMLAVGYEWGTPVTTATRLAEFQAYADRLQQQRREINYTGGVVLDGLRYEFARLNRAIDLAAVDSDGAALVTGLEHMGALVTDVEYDYEKRITTLLFSSDQLAVAGFSPEFLKARLQIKALQQIRVSTLSYDIRFNGNSTVSNTTQTIYVDPITGQQG
jgi:hypothetical protein